MLQDFFQSDMFTIIFRLVLSFFVGVLMGLGRERSFKDMNAPKAAGFRTYTLVCFGSTIFGLTSIYGFPTLGPTYDPGRIAAQVVTGVGFLGAGVIIKNNGTIKGLTTAAGIWVASAIGLMISSGMYIPTLFASILAFIILDFHRLFPNLYSRMTKTDEDRRE
ncbi:MgtC/SapB family protein [Microaerobacter geothermalis]|uniref:MgtC/SapB family protein n=1 Tax=Microaerobacter geothermalis TaxID=674972 RepID=UPI001F18A654|nr:MgtC/SapB family protein [Microaerobacter geothermalis]MCF6093459.1 MgtC/SapB family protein [Microaerobacter geothermalis]